MFTSQKLKGHIWLFYEILKLKKNSTVNYLSKSETAALWGWSPSRQTNCYIRISGFPRFFLSSFSNLDNYITTRLSFPTRNTRALHQPNCATNKTLNWYPVETKLVTPWRQDNTTVPSIFSHWCKMADFSARAGSVRRHPIVCTSCQTLHKKEK
jgi:hypothetical protein